MIFKSLSNKNSRGDTIIEVVVCTAVIGLALAAGYTLTTHALRTGIAAGQRTEALYLAQGQIEFLKNANRNKVADTKYACPTSNPSCLDSSDTTQQAPFCINNLNSSYQVAPTNIVDASVGSYFPPNPCVNYGNNPYNVYVQYKPSTKVFTVTSSWSSFSSNNQDQLNLYYKLP
jgi:Tfp pilus assembly protein PilV